MTESKPLVWLVSRAFTPDEGGVQTYAAELAGAYAELEHDVSLFVKSSAGPRRIWHGAMRMVDVGPGGKLVVYARLLAALRTAWRAGPRPIAIHACTWRAALVALLFPAPLIVTVHGREIGRPGGFAFSLMRHVLDHASRIVAVSETTRALLLRRLPHLAGKCVVAWNGTSACRPAARSTGAAAGDGITRILTVCRLVPRKNVAAGISAVADALRAGHALSYAIVGRGAEMAGLQRLIDMLGVGGQVRLLGYVDDAALDRLRAEADIFLHPQIALEDGAEIEGFGISVADAMACGLACIVGEAGGPAEFVRDGQTGLVVDGRSVEAIGGALRLLLENPLLRSEIGLRARLWAGGHLSWRRHGAISLAMVDTAGAGARESA
ncbi:glycosyltransferase family 4 protein [Sphingomonas sp. YL-JM2C]